MVDQHDRAAGDAHPAHLRREPRRARHDRGDIERQYRVERVVLEIEVLRVHDMEPRDIGELLLLDPAPGLRQHFCRDVDPRQMRIRTEIRQRQTGADPDFEDALARPVIGDTHRFLAPGMKDRAKNNVIRPGKQPISADGIAQVHRIASRGYRRECSGDPLPSVTVLPVAGFVNPAASLHRITVMRSASSPFLPSTTSTRTRCPGSRVLTPLRRRAVIWMKTSLPPPSGEMNP